jgi:hypothetical protein
MKCSNHQESIYKSQNGKKGMKISEWIKWLKNPDTTKLIEIFGSQTQVIQKRKKRKKKNGKYLIKCSLNHHPCAPPQSCCIKSSTSTSALVPVSVL